MVSVIDTDKREVTLRQDQGASVHVYNTFFKHQGGVCFMCKCPPEPGKNFHMDHDHETLLIRGLLCGTCNALIGFAREKCMVLANAIKYLQRPTTDYALQVKYNPTISRKGIYATGHPQKREIQERMNDMYCLDSLSQK